MKKIILLIAFLFALLFCAQADETAEWVFCENEPGIRFDVLTASSDNKHMLIYTMNGAYPACISNLYLLNPSSGVVTPLDFSGYADEEAAKKLIEKRYESAYGKNSNILNLLFEREGVYDPCDFLISRGHTAPARLIDLRDDYALVSLPDYCSIVVNLKTGEAYISENAYALGADGTCITWDKKMVFHWSNAGELIRTYLPEISESESIGKAHINSDGTLAVYALSAGENYTYNHTFYITDGKGNAEKSYPLAPSPLSYSAILAAPDKKTYVLLSASGLYYPAYFFNTESDEINMLRMDSAIVSDKYVYAAVQTAYDLEARYETKLLPLRFNDQNELIALCVTGDSDLVKINPDTNEVTVLLTGNAWRSLLKEKFTEDETNLYQTLLVSAQSHNGSGILSVFPGGAVRHEP